MGFEIIGEIERISTIAVGRGIRDLKRLRRVYGSGLWRKRKGIAVIRLADDRIRRAEIHWYEAHGLGRSRSSAGSRRDVKRRSWAGYVLCIANRQYPASLELLKVYRALKDDGARRDGFVRIIDESGEDYLYPKNYFVSIDLPRSARRALPQR